MFDDVIKKRETYSFYCFYLDKPSSLKLFPSTERIEKKKGSELSIMWLQRTWDIIQTLSSNTYDAVRHSTFLRLDFKMLKVKDSGRYTCNITDDESIEAKSFQ